jgi:hypothetical protein
MVARDGPRLLPQVKEEGQLLRVGQPGREVVSSSGKVARVPPVAVTVKEPR